MGRDLQAVILSKSTPSKIYAHINLLCYLKQMRRAESDVKLTGSDLYFFANFLWDLLTVNMDIGIYEPFVSALAIQACTLRAIDGACT